MATKKIYHYTVTGTGAFPVDMLRYDSCWPERTEDAISIVKPEVHSSKEEIRNVTLNRRSVRMVSNYPPTSDRWNSFGWRVADTIGW